MAKKVPSVSSSAVFPLPVSLAEWCREKHHFIPGAQHSGALRAGGDPGKASSQPHGFKVGSLLVPHASVGILQVCLLQHLFCDKDLILGPVSPNTYFPYVYLSKYIRCHDSMSLLIKAG